MRLQVARPRNSLSLGSTSQQATAVRGPGPSSRVLGLWGELMSAQLRPAFAPLGRATECPLQRPHTHTGLFTRSSRATLTGTRRGLDVIPPNVQTRKLGQRPDRSLLPSMLLNQELIHNFIYKLQQFQSRKGRSCVSGMLWTACSTGTSSFICADHKKEWEGGIKKKKKSTCYAGWWSSGD